MRSWLTLLALLVLHSNALGGLAFDATSNGTATGSGTEVTAAPATICAWFRPANATTNYFLASLGDTATDNEWFALASRGAEGGDPVRAFTASGGPSAGALTSTGYTADTWHLACGVYSTASSRAAFLNGGSKGTETTALTPSGIDAVGVGFLTRQNPVGYFSGTMAEVGVWARALSDSEVAALQYYSPRCLGRTLLNYYRLSAKVGTTERDEIGSTRTDLTLGSGTSSGATHPRLILCE